MRLRSGAGQKQRTMTVIEFSQQINGGVYGEKRIGSQTRDACRVTTKQRHINLAFARVEHWTHQPIEMFEPGCVRVQSRNPDQRNAGFVSYSFCRC